MAQLPKDSLGAKTPELRSHLDKTIMLIEEEWNRIREAYAHLNAERDSFEKMKEKIASVHIPEIVKLNIGGQLFATSKANLFRDADSMFAAMFSGRGFKVEPDPKDGSYFIDRDGRSSLSILLSHYRDVFSLHHELSSNWTSYCAG